MIFKFFFREGYKTKAEKLNLSYNFPTNGEEKIDAWLS